MLTLENVGIIQPGSTVPSLCPAGGSLASPNRAYYYGRASGVNLVHGRLWAVGHPSSLTSCAVMRSTLFHSFAQQELEDTADRFIK
jgi:hypothetical protein